MFQSVAKYFGYSFFCWPLFYLCFNPAMSFKSSDGGAKLSINTYA